MNEPRYPICPDCQENLTAQDSLHVCPCCGLTFNVEPATAITEKRFATKPEANAFVEGVEYVNDSALEVLGVLKRGKGWVVRIADEDHE
jgi:hypothetical protein